MERPAVGSFQCAAYMAVVVERHALGSQPVADWQGVYEGWNRPRLLADRMPPIRRLPPVRSCHRAPFAALTSRGSAHGVARTRRVDCR
jgi:hypothetical protein